MAPKVRPWEARFGPELDWEKLWRDQVFGAKMTETNGNKSLEKKKFVSICLGHLGPEHLVPPQLFPI